DHESAGPHPSSSLVHGPCLPARLLGLLRFLGSVRLLGLVWLLEPVRLVHLPALVGLVAALHRDLRHVFVGRFLALDHGAAVLVAEVARELAPAFTGLA